jgi:hypothetical protein
MSKILSDRAVRGLVKLGDAFVSGDGEYPSFSQLGCIEYLDSVIQYLPRQDLRDMSILLVAMSFMPQFVLRGFLRMIEITQHLPGFLGYLPRAIKIGVKGLVTMLYYSGYKGRHYKGKTPLELMGYQTFVYTGDQK